MTKYYRVRTPEQWGWLKNKLEVKEDLPVSYFPVTILDGDVFCGIYKYHDDPEPLIEVSQMMEDEEMEDYVEIKGNDLFEVKNDVGHTAFTGRGTGTFYSDDYFTKLNIPKFLLYPKVRMSVVEKKEFDWLKDNAGSLYYALDYIDEERYNRGTIPHLFDAIYGDNAKIKEIVFARAWADPNLIEVIPEKKFNVKVPFIDDEFYYKNDVGGLYHAPVAHNYENNQQFTTEELKHYGLDNDLFEKVEVTDDGTK